jgi:hypothetical protein
MVRFMILPNPNCGRSLSSYFLSRRTRETDVPKSVSDHKFFTPDRPIARLNRPWLAFAFHYG